MMDADKELSDETNRIPNDCGGIYVYVIVSPIIPIVKYLLSEKQRFFNAIVLAIYDGDPKWLRKQSEAMDGDIVVALVANENTLKRYFVDKENQKIRLHPENKTMKDIIVSDCKIQGVAVKVIKNLE